MRAVVFACLTVHSSGADTFLNDGRCDCHQAAAVVQDAGFVASSSALFGGAAFSVATGLLIAEVRPLSGITTSLVRSAVRA